ncbi:hypothetical protein ACFFX0_07945 [Citricoccus parietis]|uniref:Uncharacterized protein n=1 Tax=Citricoccus parietis TaxID=592307 RepID=A0ABV5FY23_9MICC
MQHGPEDSDAGPDQDRDQQRHPAASACGAGAPPLPARARPRAGRGLPGRRRTLLVVPQIRSGHGRGRPYCAPRRPG